MNLEDCHNYDDFRKLAKKKLPSPIFHYIDGGSDDEVTLKRNTEAFNDCDLIPNVLTDVGNIDLSTTVLGQKIHFPFFLLNLHKNGSILLHIQWQILSLLKAFRYQLFQSFLNVQRFL